MTQERRLPLSARIPGSDSWTILALVTFANLLSMLDRQILPVTAPLIIHDLGLSLTQFGALVGPMFVALYTISSLSFGVLADRWPRGRIISGGLALWSGATLMTGAAASFARVGLGRMFLGIGEAALGPAAISLLGEEFETRRGLALGIYYMAAPVGSGVALLFSSVVVPFLGWRPCFYILGAIGLAGVPVLFFKLSPRGPRSHVTSSSRAMVTLPEFLRVIARVPSLQLLLLAGVLTDFTLGSQSLIMAWLVRERSADFHLATINLGVLTVVAGLLGNLAGGAASDYFESRRSGGRLYFLGVMQIVVLPFALVLFLGPYRLGSLPFSACYFVLVVGTLMKYGSLFAAVQELPPTHLKATAVAIFLITANVCGLASGSLVGGILGDHFSLTVSLAVCTSAAALAAVPCWIAASRYQTDRAQTAQWVADE